MKLKRKISALVTVILVITVSTGFQMRKPKTDAPWRWAQELKLEQVLSVTAWQSGGDLRELTEDQTESLVMLLNNLSREDFTENRQSEHEAVPFGIRIETVEGPFILNDSSSPNTPLAFSNEDANWWVDNESLSMFLVKLYENLLTQEAVPVSADYAADNLMRAYSHYDEFCQMQDEYAQRILITANSRVSDFRFSKISFVEQNSEMSVIADTGLYTQKYLDPDIPLVVCVSFPGSIPQRGISFTTENGERRNFTIEMSGKDGSIVLHEY